MQNRAEWPLWVRLQIRSCLTEDLNLLNCIRFKDTYIVLVVKNLSVNAGDVRDAGSIPRLGRSPGEGNSNPLQYSCLENPIDRGAWWATVHGVAKSPYD